MKELIIRPNSLTEFIGKQDLKEALNVYIQSAIQQEKQLDHILLYGSAGVGKTTLARLVAQELGVRIHYLQGPSIQQISDILDLVSMLNTGDVIFLDEAHKINKRCLEMFYGILEDFVVDVKVGKELNTQYSRLNIPKFTMICATTNIGELPSSFLDRFGIRFFVDTYDVNEIGLILEAIVKKNNLEVNGKEIKLIANHCKGVPRLAINLLNRYHDYKLVHPNKSCEEVFKAIGVLPHGLNQIDLMYLKILASTPLTGVKTISQQLLLDCKTIENIIEPYLLRIGFMMKKSNGRKITKKGLIYLNSL